MGNPDFSHIDYRDLYYSLFFEAGRHIDGLITVLHKIRGHLLAGVADRPDNRPTSTSRRRIAEVES